MSTFRLVVSSVSGAQFDGQAVSATMPGASGEMTVLAHHQPFITTLKPGVITVKTENESKEFPVGGGVVECVSDRVTVLL